MELAHAIPTIICVAVSCFFAGTTIGVKWAKDPAAIKVRTEAEKRELREEIWSWGK